MKTKVLHGYSPAPEDERSRGDVQDQRPFLDQQCLRYLRPTEGREDRRKQMTDTAILFGWIASLVLAVYVGRHAVRRKVKEHIDQRLMMSNDNNRFQEGYNTALIELDDLLITREWVKPLRSKGTI